ncbi:MAG TPA: alpha/beta fold hydrolase [Pyrinomonadaceae bacterium]|nr:alpha/beta fold hydrolase [Pyrinomonadaceae bacterium]
MTTSKILSNWWIIGILLLLLIFASINIRKASAAVSGNFLQKDEGVLSTFRPFPIFLGHMQQDSAGSNLYVGLYGMAGECVYSNFFISEYQTEADMRNNTNAVASAPFKHTFWLLRDDGSAVDNPFGAGPSITSPRHFALQVQPDQDFTKFRSGHWYAINGPDCGDQSRTLTLYGKGQQVFWIASDNKYQSLSQLTHPYDNADTPLTSPPAPPTNPYVYINQIYKQIDGGQTWIYVRWTLLGKWTSEITAVYPSLNSNLPDNSFLDRSLGMNLDQGSYMWKLVGSPCNIAGPGPEDYTTGQQYITRFPSISGVNAADISSDIPIRFTIFYRTIFDSSPCNMERKTAFPDPTDFHVQPLSTPTPTPTPEAVPVIFIPGIMGSEIGYDDDSTFQPLWPSFFHPFDSVQDMRKTPAGDEIDGVNKRARNVIESVIEFRGLKFHDVYGSFLGRMNDEGFSLGVDCANNLGKRLFTFPYDWRDSISNSAYLRDKHLVCPATARNLADRISQVMTATGASEVDIVAHSMGGLVALEYLRDSVQNGRPHHIRKLITVATPYLGSPAAFQALRYGRPLPGFGRLLINTFESKRISHNLSGTYQLLPSEKYFDSAAVGPYGAPRYILDPDDNDANGNRNPTTYTLTRNFLENAPEQFNPLPSEDYKGQDPTKRTLNGNLINEAHTFHAALDSFAQVIPSDVSLYTISAWGQLTNRLYEDRLDIKGCVDDFGQVTFCPYVRTIADQAGDRTVPLWSASWPNANGRYFLKLPMGVDHADLLKDQCVQHIVTAILKNFQINCDSVYSVSNAPPSVSEVSRPQWSVEVFSPANLHLIDLQGRHTGPLNEGGFEEQVAQSSYEAAEDNGFEQLNFVVESGLVLRIEGTGLGSFDLKIYETMADETIRALIYRNVPVNDHTKGFITPEVGAPLPVLRLDHNGDGIVEEEIRPLQVFAGSDPVEVSIDISPGSVNNPVSLSKQGLLTVAILSTTRFDAWTVDPLTVRFGRGQVIEAHQRAHNEDVNHDGRADMVLHFRIQESGILSTDRAVCLTGKLRDVTLFQGCDRITVLR